MIKEIVKDVEFLKQKSEDFNFETDKDLIRDLLDTAKHHSVNCVGLAAPQKANFFINTLPERGVKDCSKKVITKISFKEREWENVIDMVREAIKKGESKVIIKRRIKPHEKETFSNMGLNILIPGPEQFELFWLDATKIKNI